MSGYYVQDPPAPAPPKCMFKGLRSKHAPDKVVCSDLIASRNEHVWQKAD